MWPLMVPIGRSDETIAARSPGNRATTVSSPPLRTSGLIRPDYRAPKSHPDALRHRRSASGRLASRPRCADPTCGITQETFGLFSPGRLGSLLDAGSTPQAYGKGEVVTMMSATSQYRGLPGPTSTAGRPVCPLAGLSFTLGLIAPPLCSRPG